MALKQNRILLTCPKAIPPLVAQEVRALGLPVLEELKSGVVTEGTLDDCQKLNLWSRAAHRVHWLIREFRARDAEELYKNLVDIPWEEEIREDGYISIASSVQNPTIRDPRFASLKCKDAVCDRIRRVCGRRPDSGSELKGAAVFLFWRGDRCAVYFDTSGEPLSRRGYRRIGLQAPMQETLAAAIILTAGWTGDTPFVNPMCGSGTLAIEAAWIAGGRAPGLLRENFAFMHLKSYNPRRWVGLRREAEALAQRARRLPPIAATDISAKAVEAARQNAKLARAEPAIEFGVCDFAETAIPAGGGVVLFNPGYGERMGEAQQLIPLYRRIGDFLKRSCKGCRGYVFTGNPKLFNKVGLRPSREWTLFNSNIECRLLEFEIY